jgi:hypothetical protein
MTISESFNLLKNYVEAEEFKGYDPYDTLNSFIPFNKLGNWCSVIATQGQKRNPINLRPLLGIKKEINPKAFGLFLQSYSMLYKQTNKREYLIIAKNFYDYLSNNYSVGYSGYCWGYNFPWSSPGEFVEKFSPTAVATGFIVKGLYQYYQVTKDPKVLEIISSAAEFVKKDLYITEIDEGVCISYTTLWRDYCFNASLLAAEILAINYILNNDEESKEISKLAIKWVIRKQTNDGKWNYSISRTTGKERKQIDFHQGYIIMSLYSIKKILRLNNEFAIDYTIEQALKYYYINQFYKDGISKWRIPKTMPIDIHNQSQGIITFCKLNHYSENYRNFAKVILNWTINNMQDKKSGHFYYRINRTHIHKTSYMRWSQAWLFLAFAYYFEMQKK